MSFKKDQPDDHKDQPQQKHKNGDAVDPMHVFHPLRMWRIRVPLLDVEIFLDLSPNSHSIKYKRPAARKDNIPQPAAQTPKVNNTGFFDWFNSNLLYLHSQMRSPPRASSKGHKKGN
jgi:hypothetical protein